MTPVVLKPALLVERDLSLVKHKQEEEEEWEWGGSRGSLKSVSHSWKTLAGPSVCYSLITHRLSLRRHSQDFHPGGRSLRPGTPFLQHVALVPKMNKMSLIVLNLACRLGSLCAGIRRDRLSVSDDLGRQLCCTVGPSCSLPGYLWCWRRD